MSSRLIDQMESRDNNYNLIRFLAATLVLFGHCYALIGVPSYDWLYGQIGVDVFFITSGFLVTNSLFIRKDIVIFTWSRFLRIFPGLLVSLLFTVFVIGVFFTTLPLSEYLFSKQIYTFIFVNTTLLISPIEYLLPGVFSGNEIAGVNGSLWTLPWELKMYCILIVFGILIHVKDAILKDETIYKIIFLIALVSTTIYFYYIYNRIDFNSNGVRFLSTFFIGSSLYILRKYIILSHRVAFLSFFILFYLLNDNIIHQLVFYSFIIPYLVLYFAYSYKGILLSFNKIGDYSYGLYIYAFPVQQATINLYPNVSPMLLFIISFIVTLVLSILSWHLLEKKMLKFKNLFNKESN